MINLISGKGLISSARVRGQTGVCRLIGTGGGSMRPAVGRLGLLAEKQAEDVVESKLRGGVGGAQFGVGAFRSTTDPSVGCRVTDGTRAASMRLGNRPVGSGPSLNPRSAARTLISCEKGLELVAHSDTGEGRTKDETGELLSLRSSSSSSSSPAMRGSEEG